MKKGTFSVVFSFAGQCRGKMLASVLLAVTGVAGGLLPYIGVYRIIMLLEEGELRLLSGKKKREVAFPE